VSATVTTGAESAVGGSIADEPVFEARGIDYIPHSERKGTPMDLALMWAGALLNIEYVVYGGILVAGFGLRFWQAALVILVGNLSYVITGIGSLQGPKAGTAGFTINRAPFGPNGARIIAVFNWMAQVGYEIVGLLIVVAVGLAMFNKAGVHTSTGLKIVVIALAGAIQLLLPLFGHGTMLRVLRAMVIPFVILLILLAALTLGKAHLGAGHNASWQTMMAGLAFVLSAGGYGWLMNSNDFSRYLPEKTSERKTIWSVALGGFIPTTLCLLLGAAIATGAGANAEYPTSLTGNFASWFFWPYLIVVLFQVFAINSLDLYTSGLTLQAIVPKIKRWQCVLLDTIIATGLTAWAVFTASFTTFINDFILFMLIWIAPWVAIFLVDYFLRRTKYDSPGLMDTAKGIYYRNGGFHWQGLVAMGIGMAASASFLSAYPAWTSPLTNATNGADFSVFMGALFGGGAYFLLARKGVAAEADATTDAEPDLATLTV